MVPDGEPSPALYRGWATTLVLTLVLAGCMGAPPEGEQEPEAEAQGFPSCTTDVRPGPRGYAVAATGPDGRVRIHTGIELDVAVDQGIYHDRWAFDAQTGCWVEEGDSPLLNWGFAYASSTDTYVGYDWVVAEDAPILANAANPASEIWTRTGDGAWRSEMRNDMPARNGPAMAYDPDHDRVVLFGGCSGVLAACLPETWVHEPADGSWTKANPSETPPGRSFHAMAHAPGLGGIVLFGGAIQHQEGTRGPSADTWIYDVGDDAWARLDVATAPPPRSYPQLAYAENVDRLYLFGGSGEAGQLNDLWYLDVENTTWVEVALEGAPTPRAWHAMAYDRASGWLVVFGGGAEDEQTFRTYTDETWLFDVVRGQWHTPDQR